MTIGEEEMTTTMTGMVRRAKERILDRLGKGGELVFEIGSQPTHRAMTVAWCSVSVSQRCRARWLGPGRYELSGNPIDGATVTKVGEPTQMELRV